jgi:hypothetical protein
MRVRARKGMNADGADAIMRQLPVLQFEGLRKVYVRHGDISPATRGADVYQGSSDGMTQGGRDPMTEGLGELSVTELRQWAARPQRSSLDHPVPVLSSATLRPQENQPRTRLVSVEGPEGARLACGKPWRSLHSGGRGLPAPFHLRGGVDINSGRICAGLVRGGGCSLLPRGLSGYPRQPPADLYG